MIEIAIQGLKDKISNLPYVEHYGGLSFPIEKVDVIGEGVSARSIKKVFPVMSTLTGFDCWNKGKYQNLVPNTKYKSLFYWEVLDDMKQIPNAHGAGYKAVTFSGSARLVYWLNLALMGASAGSLLSEYGNYTLGPLVQGNLISELEGKRFGLNSGALQGTSISLKKAGVVVKDARIFSRYSYGNDISALLMYPYDFGAIDFKIEMTMPRSCIADVTELAPLNCITEW